MKEGCMFFDASDGTCNYRKMAGGVLRLATEDLTDRANKGERVQKQLNAVQFEREVKVPSLITEATEETIVFMCPGARQGGLGSYLPEVDEQKACDRYVNPQEISIITQDFLRKFNRDIPKMDTDLLRRVLRIRRAGAAQSQR